MGSQHPSPNVKTFCNFEPQIWREIITSRDAESTCFKGSRTSCDVIILGNFWPNFGRKRSHHVMDASCRFKWLLRSSKSLPGPSDLGVRKVSETVSKQSLESQKRLALKTHTPQFWGVKISPPKLRERMPKNTLKQVISEDPTPPNLGVNLRPPNLGG